MTDEKPVPPFDSVGVLVRKNKYGKYDTFLTFTFAGKVVHEERVGEERTAPPSWRIAHETIDLLSLRLNRKKYQFEVDR